VGVIIGMDPHKRSATIEVIDERGAVLAKARFGTDKIGYRDMLAAGPSVPGSGVGGGGVQRRR
jgi:transposase